MKPHNLKTQYLHQPLGLQTKTPHFSYSIHANENHKKQTAYQILAATTQEQLQNGFGDLWDSQKTKGSYNYAIPYQGRALLSGQRVYWKVRIWDEKDNACDWSENSFFEMGLLEQSDWVGEWIGQGDEYQGSQSTAPLFIKDFLVDAKRGIEKARLYISGLGLFCASINGKSLSDTFYDPGESDASKTVYYVTYDLLPFLRESNNTIGVILGNGQYSGFLIDPVMTDHDGKPKPPNRYQKNDGKVFRQEINGRKKLLAQIELTYCDGTKKTYATDSTWVWRIGPVVFQNWYGGEDYDATLEVPQWNTVHHPTDGWESAKVMKAPQGKLTAREFPPIRMVQKTMAKSVRKLDNGNWLVDMGRNGAGFLQFHLTNTTPEMKGTWVCFYPAELLREDGSGVEQASCTQSWSETYQCSIKNAYCIKGTGNEEWNPMFAYQGFQYVEITGFDGVLEPENFHYCFVRTDNEKYGNFSTSSQLDQINTMVEHSIESNMFGSFTDCPQIEKLGWIETSHLMFRSMAGTYDIRAWMRKIIQDMVDSQLNQEDAEIENNEAAGYIPAIVPEYQRIMGLHRDPNWGGACVFTPWEYYWYYNDVSVLELAYPAMKKYVKYLQGFLKNGVLEDYAQMGEWGQLNENTPNVLIATCSYYKQLVCMSEIAGILGLSAEQEEHRKQAETVKISFHHHPLCYDNTLKQYGNGSQASYGAVLFSGIVDDQNKAVALEKLVETIRHNDYHLTSGEVGLKQVFWALAEHGRSDVVYRMVANPTKPSYRFFVEEGLTTLPEYWNCDELWHGMARSRNHAMMGHVKEWFSSYVLGIKALKAGFEEFVIAPYFPEGVNHIRGSVRSPFGDIRLDIEQTKTGYQAEIDVPTGVSGTLCLKDAKTQKKYRCSLDSGKSLLSFG